MNIEDTIKKLRDDCTELLLIANPSPTGLSSGVVSPTNIKFDNMMFSWAAVINSMLVIKSRVRYIYSGISVGFIDQRLMPKINMKYYVIGNSDRDAPYTPFEEKGTPTLCKDVEEIELQFRNEPIHFFIEAYHNRTDKREIRLLKNELDQKIDQFKKEVEDRLYLNDLFINSTGIIN